MSEKHRYTPISQVQEGMVIANELLDKQGHILLPTGFVLTEKTITSLQQHEVLQLSIFISESEDVLIEDKQNEEQSNQVKEKLQRLDIIFRHAPFEEPRNTLVQLITKYRIGDTT